MRSEETDRSRHRLKAERWRHPKHAEVIGMSNLKIRVFTEDNADPDTTVTIPGLVLKFATRLIPGQAKTALLESGIDLDELARLAIDPAITGTLIEIEDHRKNEKIVISLE
ncbi:hypothetical protein BI364_02120 [Acidihalobacter yilgarnensis]|uniref:Uncharacterized protein n=2 Tax=Acidihalobacter yilgarnensis TaxID=2819280 RepID=A0A1D8IKG4_9GAMM|nr:hypothetical protein BI364_02120 [Acidihalobacter yilgarnensis]